MAWVYNGNRTAFGSITDFGTLYVGGAATFDSTARFNGQEDHYGSETHNGQVVVNGNEFHYGTLSVVNEKFITTLRPVVQPGPQLRTTPNIQFQPRTLNGVLSSGGAEAIACLLSPIGMVEMKGGFLTTKASRANGTVIADLNNTALEQRLFPAYNHHWIVDGLGNGSGYAPTIMLSTAGQFLAYNFASGSTGTLPYFMSGSWFTNQAEVQGIFYGNGGY